MTTEPDRSATPSRPRPRPLAGVGLLVAVGVAALVTVGVVAWRDTGDHGAEASAATIGPNRSLVSSGGQFLATCDYTHSAMNDPIVHHGMAGMSHRHEFFGNTATDESSTVASLLAAPSACSDVGDHSAYWVPELIVNGSRAVPRRVDAYYRVAPGVRAADVKPFPSGLQALAGDQFSEHPQALGVVAWACGMSPEVATSPPSGCTTDRPLQLRLTFPSCWNGHDVATADHTSHLAYPTPSGCPSSHPVALPQLTIVVHYPVTGAVRTVELASGAVTTAHGDFFEAWSPARMEAQVTGCIDRSVVCGIVGGTFHTGLGSADVDDYNLTH